MNHCQVILDWDSSNPGAKRCGLLPAEDLPKEGTATMLAIEFAEGDAAPGEKKGKGGGKGKAAGGAKVRGSGAAGWVGRRAW
jgi:hypothetical protein